MCYNDITANGKQMGSGAPDFRARNFAVMNRSIFSTNAARQAN